MTSASRSDQEIEALFFVAPFNLLESYKDNTDDNTLELGELVERLFGLINIGLPSLVLLKHLQNHFHHKR